MRTRVLPFVATGGLALIVLGAGASPHAQRSVAAVMSPLFAPVDLSASLDRLPDNERRALGKIIKAARVMDGIFLEQVWAGNPSLLLEMLADRSARGRAQLDFFLVNKGPWSRLDDDRPFVPGIPPKPPGANYYPADASKEELETWFDTLNDEERRVATGFFTTIRRSPDGGLVAVPYKRRVSGPPGGRVSTSS